VFEDLLRKWDETYNEILDKQYMVQIMVAEMHLCERMHASKETLIAYWEATKEGRAIEK